MISRLSSLSIAVLFSLALALAADAWGQQQPPAAVAENPAGASILQRAEKPAAASDSVPAAASHEEPAEAVAIRDASRAFAKAFDAHDAKAVAACWTEDGAYVDDAGVVYDGRQAIEKEYAKFFAEQPDVKIRLFVDSIRMLSDSAAIEDGRVFVDSPAGAAPVYGKYVAIHVKSGDQWLMSMVRDERIEVASAYQNVADLEWLIGEWTAEEGGVRSTSVCRWIANQSFVERRYAATNTDGTTTAGVQIIGWNPASERIQSWSFTSDGGHAVGVWSPVADGWVADVAGVTGSGVPTRAVNHLRKLDHDAYVWRSTDRTLGDRPLPDSAEVVMRRAAPDR